MEQFNNEQGHEQEKVFRGAIVIVYKNIDGELLYLIVENKKTENVSFVSGGEEDEDKESLEKTAQREIEEELGLEPNTYQLIPTEVKHDFVFNAKKAERAGKKASYQVFLADASSIKKIGHTSELKNTSWMTKEQVMSSLTFPELRELFEKAIGEIKA